MNVVVASGDSAPGVSIPQLDISVKAHKIDQAGNAEYTSERATLNLLDVVVSRDIHTSVISESYFLKTNPNFILITQGETKYLVYRKVDIQTEPIDGIGQYRFDCAYRDGTCNINFDAEIMDHTTTKAKPRNNDDTCIKIAVRPDGEKPSDTAMLNMMHVTSRDEETMTNGMPFALTNTVTATHVYVTAVRKEAYDNMSDAN